MPAYRPPSEPVGVGTLVSRTFSVWSKHLWLFAAFTLVVFIPGFLVMMVTAVGGAFAMAGMAEAGAV